MDFKKVFGVFPRIEITPDNNNLRRDIYLEFSNTTSLQTSYVDIVVKFKTFIENKLLVINIIGSPELPEDILYSFFKTVEFKSREKKERNTVTVEALELVPKTNEIIHKHINMLSEMKDSTDTSDSDSGEDDAPLKKKLKTCQKAINIDCDGMLKFHRKNIAQITGTTVHMDILIFTDKSVCKQLSKYLGLIYIEDLLIEADESNMDRVLFRLYNNNAKLTRLIQSYINKNLINGYNNICLVHTIKLFVYFKANVKAVISSKNKGIERYSIRAAIEYANFDVELNKDATILDYIESISVIVDNALKCKAHIIAKYIHCNDKENNTYYNVKLPLISIVPLYVLRYFIQSVVPEKLSGIQSSTSN